MHPLLESFRALPRAERRRRLARLPREKALIIRYAWELWARPSQRPPAALSDGSLWRIWLILAGRGFGKTRTGAETVIERVREGRARYIALASGDPADVRDVMVEGPAGILARSPPWFRPTYEPSKRRLTWPNGAVAMAFSGENPEQARGPQHDFLWADELCAWSKAQELWDNLELGLRLNGPKGDPPQGLVTTTPKPTKTLKTIMAAPDTVITRGSTFENKANLSAAALRALERKYKGSRLGRQELFAEVLEDVDGALWTLAILDRCRVSEPPADLVRVVVAVDPAVTSGADSDETGIVVVGVDVFQHAYVLADRSCRLGPKGWARRVIEAYEEFRADCVVAEVNNGGELVASNIQVVDPRVPVKMVHAKRGKRTRAEPVSTLYELDDGPRVHHVGVFEVLEAQMTQWTGLAGDVSPDRMDAFVYAVTELLLEGSDVGFA